MKQDFQSFSNATAHTPPSRAKDNVSPQAGAISIFIGLGSNLGDPPRNLAAAVTALEKRGFSIAAASSVYLTEPQGYRDQPWFANQVIGLCAANGLTPLQLLDVLLEEETRLGRVRSTDPGLRFGPRLIDMDLLLFGATVIHTPRLILPHPRLAERAFMLVPLLELAPDLVFPDGQRAEDALRALPHTIEGNVIRQQTEPECLI